MRYKEIFDGNQGVHIAKRSHSHPIIKSGTISDFLTVKNPTSLYIQSCIAAIIHCGRINCSSFQYENF